MSEKITKKISVIIPIHNRLNITKEGLKCLHDSLEIYNREGAGSCDYKVIVVDDGSTDGSSEWISENYPDTNIVKGDGNLWWSGAINRGAQFAINKLNSDWILLWNDDAVPAKNYFLQLEQVLLTPNIADTIIGSKILYKNNPTKIWSVGGYFNRFTGSYGMYNEVKQTDRFMQCDWLAGMGTLVPVALIKKYNIWWDEKRFPQYHGDSDYILRCKRLGVTIVTCLDLVLYNNTETTGLTTKRNLREAIKGATSIRSNFNFRKYLMFYSDHGLFPIAYTGLFKKYFYYFGGFIKHSIINRNHLSSNSFDKQSDYSNK